MCSKHIFLLAAMPLQDLRGLASSTFGWKFVKTKCATSVACSDSYIEHLVDIHLICHHCCTSVQKGGQNRLQVFHSMNCSSFRIFILDSQEAHFRKRRINQATKRSSVPSWHIAIRCCREATLSCGISQQDLSCECHGGSLSDRISVYG